MLLLLLLPPCDFAIQFSINAIAVFGRMERSSYYDQFRDVARSFVRIKSVKFCLSVVGQEKERREGGSSVDWGMRKVSASGALGLSSPLSEPIL